MRGELMGWTTEPKWVGIEFKDGVESPIQHKTEFSFKYNEYKNKVPTHDPYANPNSHIYYQCDCGAILDPGTLSFAQLNNVASEKGWKVRWRPNGDSYQPFCVKCGEDVE